MGKIFQLVYRLIQIFYRFVITNGYIFFEGYKCNLEKTYSFIVDIEYFDIDKGIGFKSVILESRITL